MSKTFRNFQNFFTTYLNPFQFFSFFKEKKRLESSLIFRNHFDSTKTIEEKKKNEKRKRNQAYIALDYILSSTTYFDFFSLDAFQIAKDAKNLTQIIEKTVVPSEFLLLSFFYTSSPILSLLKNYGITKQLVEKKITQSSLNSDTNNNTFTNTFSFPKEIIEKLLSYISFDVEEIVPNDEINYSLEVNRLFEKAAENAVERFKNPVIGTEVLFLTMMEEKNTRVGKLINSFFDNESDWLLLRYNLIKRLYRHESSIRNFLIPNLHYFAYLLKTRLSDKDFENILNNDYLKDTVSKFRNELISEILKINIYDLLKKDVYLSISRTKKNVQRNYSLEVDE